MSDQFSQNNESTNIPEATDGNVNTFITSFNDSGADGGFSNEPANQLNVLEEVTWTASEYIAHQKHISWFLVFGAGTVLLTVAIYFVTGGSLLSAFSVLIFALLFGVYAGRQPRELHYALDNYGVNIGVKRYDFATLKSFSIIDEGPFSSIVFMPLKRFMPLISIYYDPADEDKIVTFLTAHLPMEYKKHDSVDRLMRKIKF